MASTIDMYGYRKYLNEKGLNGEPTYGPSYMNTVPYPKTMISPKAETITGPGQPAAANMAGLYGPPAPGATMPPANTFNSPAAKMAAMYGPPAPTRTAGTSTPQKSVVQPTTQPTAQPDYLSMLNKAAATFSAPRQPFQYNAQADPQYQQALQAAQQGAATQQGNTLARLRSMGQGKSSYSEGVAQQIGQQAVADVNAQQLPQFTAQAYQRYLDQQNMGRQNALDLLGLGREYNNLNQQGLDNTFRQEQADRDNTYRDQAFGEQRKQNNLDAALRVGQQLGRVIDPKEDYGLLFNQTEAPLNLQGQQLQYQQSRDQIADEQYKQKFDEDVRRYGLDYAQRAASQANQFANAAADNARANTQLDLQRQRFDFDKEQANKPKEQKANTGAYKTNPDFATDYQFVKTNPEKAKQSLQTNAADFINEYGFDGYMDLLKGLPKEAQDETMKLLESILGG